MRLAKITALACLIPLFICACADSENAGESSTVTSAEAVLSEAPDTRAEEIKEAEKMINSVDGLKYVMTEEPYNFTGRWFEKEIDGVTHHVTVNDGSELYFAVYGTDGIEVNFTVITSLKTPYFAYSIDGAAPVRQLITEPHIALPDSGAHLIRIIADGMTESENKFNGEAGFAFRDVEVNGGKLIGIKPLNKVIMFFGDSITEGVRALSMDADSDGNSATHSYPWYCCERLGAVPVNVGFAASGIVGAGSFAPCLDAIDKLSATRSTDDIPAPDVIVLAHGHNDIYFSKSDFDWRYKAVLDRLHEKYPDSKLFVLIPYAQVHAEDIRECVAGRDYITLIETEGWDPATTDGIHLSAVGAKYAGKKLAEALEASLGADFFKVG